MMDFDHDRIDEPRTVEEQELLEAVVGVLEKRLGDYVENFPLIQDCARGALKDYNEYYTVTALMFAIAAMREGGLIRFETCDCAIATALTPAAIALNNSRKRIIDRMKEMDGVN